MSAKISFFILLLTVDTSAKLYTHDLLVTFNHKTKKLLPLTELLLYTTDCSININGDNLYTF